MFNRKLKRRLKSLEEYLGLAYVKAEAKYDSDQHIPEEGEWGFVSKVKKLLKKNETPNCK